MLKDGQPLCISVDCYVGYRREETPLRTLEPHNSRKLLFLLWRRGWDSFPLIRPTFNDLGRFRNAQSSQNTRNLSIRYKTGTAKIRASSSPHWTISVTTSSAWRIRRRVQIGGSQPTLSAALAAGSVRGRRRCVRFFGSPSWTSFATLFFGQPDFRRR